MELIIIGGGCYGLYHSSQLYKAIQKGKLPSDTRLVIVDRNAEPRVKKEIGLPANFRFVQSDWLDFLVTFLENRANYQTDNLLDNLHIIPPPYAPHLFYEWVRLSALNHFKNLGYSGLVLESEVFDYKLQTPYELTNREGKHFISRAGWTCPATCIEPHLCPAVKGPRDWELKEDLENFIRTGLVQASKSAEKQLKEAGLQNGREEPIPGELLSGVFDATQVFTCYHFTHGVGSTPARQLVEARERIIKLALTLDAQKKEARVAMGTVSHCHGVVATLLIKKIL